MILVSLVGTALAGIPPVPCKTIITQECWDEPRSVCNTVQKPFTSITFDQKCNTVSDQVCNTVVDTLVDFVPRQECTTLAEQKCNKVPKQDCNIIQVPKTTTVPEQKCWDESDQQCFDEQDQKCTTVFDKQCVDKVDQTCSKVKVPVARTKLDRVFQRLLLVFLRLISACSKLVFGNGSSLIRRKSCAIVCFTLILIRLWGRTQVLYVQ